MMKVAAIVLACVLMSSGVFASDVPSQAAGVQLVDVSAPNADLAKTLQAQVQEAQQKGLTPYVQLVATWCSHCHKLDASLSQPLMQDAYKGAYIVRLDFDTYRDQLAELGFNVNKGVPAIYGMNAQGKPTGRLITGAAWGADTPENMAPPIKQFFAQNQWK
jgi:hypothetical protein